MKDIKNLQEKRLIIARHIMLDQIEPTDENIISMWCKTFSADRYKLEHTEDTELFDWMRKFISNNNVKSCKEQLVRLRRIGKECIELPGEIDVLFVFECKNIATRTTYDMINSLRIDLISDYKNTSFQKKLKFKIDRLKDNIEIVEKFVGTQNTIRDVAGCIVTKGFYFRPVVTKNSVYDVITWSELTDLVNRYIDKENMN